MSLAFWDTMLFVYWVEDHPEFAPRIAAIHGRMRERKDQLVTSALAMGEVLAGPYSPRNTALALRYKPLSAPPTR